MKTTILLKIVVCISFFGIQALCPSTFAQSYSVLVAGDMTPAYRITAPTNFFSEEIKGAIAARDLFLWNCETSGPSPFSAEKKFVFKTDTVRMKNMSFANGLATVANNHVLDGGVSGGRALLKILQDNSIPFVGMTLSSSRIDGKELAFAAAYKTKTASGEKVYVFAGTPMLPKNTADLYMPKTPDIVEAILEIRKTDVQAVVIVYLHDGREGAGKNEATERQKAQAAALAWAGSDAVIFAHSHTYMSVSNIGSTLVAWSVGNAIFGGNSSWKNHDMNFLDIQFDLSKPHVPKSHRRSDVALKPRATYEWYFLKIKNWETQQKL